MVLPWLLKWKFMSRTKLVQWYLGINIYTWVPYFKGRYLDFNIMSFWMLTLIKFTYVFAFATLIFFLIWRCYQLRARKWIKNSGLCLFLFPELGAHLVQTHVASVYASKSFCDFICSSVFTKPSFLGILHIFWLLQYFNLMLSRVLLALSPEGEEFDGDNPFRIVCSEVSYSPHAVWLWVSVFVSIYYSWNHL